MSNHDKQKVSPEKSSSPRRIRSLGELAVPASYNELTIAGYAPVPYAREVPLPADGLVFVGMNSAAYTRIPENDVGQIYTVALGGCTGIAGVAKAKGEILAGISHFDPVVDASQRENGISPSERFMGQFISVARKAGAKSIELRIFYSGMQKTDPRYGQFGDNYDDWHFVDQLESFVEEAEDDVQAGIESYEDMSGRTLAVDVDHGQTDIVFR